MNQLLEAVLLGVKQLTPDNLKVAYSFIRKMQPSKEAQNRVDELAWNSGMVCTDERAHEERSKLYVQELEELAREAYEREESQKDKVAAQLEFCKRLTNSLVGFQEIAAEGPSEKKAVAGVTLMLLFKLSDSEAKGWLESVAESVAKALESEDESSGTFKS